MPCNLPPIECAGKTCTYQTVHRRLVRLLGLGELLLEGILIRSSRAGGRSSLRRRSSRRGNHSSLLSHCDVETKRQRKRGKEESWAGIAPRKYNCEGEKRGRGEARVDVEVGEEKFHGGGGNLGSGWNKFLFHPQPALAGTHSVLQRLCNPCLALKKRVLGLVVTRHWPLC